MPRVLVDLLFFTGRQGGTETVAREIYSRLADRPGWEFIGYASAELVERGADWFPGQLIDSGLRTTNRAQWLWGELTGVAEAARRAAADVIHSPANFGPPASPVPLVLTLHDVLAFRHPEFLPSRIGRIPTRWLIRRAAAAATHIVTDSDDARADIIDIFGFDASRVTVVRPGAPALDESTEQVRSAAELFSLGNRMPHKNFPLLLEALALIPPSRRPRLTISGSHEDDPLRPVVDRLGLGPWVSLESWLPSEEIARLYRTSTAMVFPTRFEGFGLPVLEAMAHGCPVLCSDIPVLHEVGGDAAIYFDPTSASAMAEAIDAALGDPQRRSSLADAGRRRVAAFRWDEATERMADVLEHAAGGA